MLDSFFNLSIELSVSLFRSLYQLPISKILGKSWGMLKADKKTRMGWDVILGYI